MNTTLPLAAGLALALASPVLWAQEHEHGLDPTLRQEIRQIVREEIRAALRDLHGTAATATQGAGKAKKAKVSDETAKAKSTAAAPGMIFRGQPQSTDSARQGRVTLPKAAIESAPRAGGWFVKAADDDAPVQRVIKVQKPPAGLRWSLEAPRASTGSVKVDGLKLTNPEIEKLQRELRELESELKQLENSIKLPGGALQKVRESNLKIETIRQPSAVRTLTTSPKVRIIATRDSRPEAIEVECCEEADAAKACCKECGATCCEKAAEEAEAPIKVVEIKSVIEPQKKAAKKID